MGRSLWRSPPTSTGIHAWQPLMEEQVFPTIMLLTSILLCLRFSSIGATRNVVFVVLDVCNIKHGQNEKVNCQKKTSQLC